MSTQLSLGRVSSSSNYHLLFHKSIKLLFAISVIGQIAFVLYIVGFYGGTAIAGDFEKWNEELQNGLITGDGMGNTVLVFHLLFAAIITIGGPTQFISSVRNRFPKFHRINGRIYFVAAFIMSIGGLYMIYTRPVVGDNVMRMGNTLNALLIMSFSILALKKVLARKFDEHKVWALRTFLVVSGVWFFRIGFGIWIGINMGSAPGINEDFTGPFLLFLSLAHTLLPLLIFEIYRWIKSRNKLTTNLIGSISFFFLSMLMILGIGMAAMIFWIH